MTSTPKNQQRLSLPLASNCSTLTCELDHYHELEEDDDSTSDSTLTTLKTHLREKYLSDIDVIQRSTAHDPEAWTKLDEITEQIESLKKLLRDTDDLILISNEGNRREEHSSNQE